MSDIYSYIINFPILYRNWWLNLYYESPQHILIETSLLIFIIWLLFIRRTVDPTKVNKKNEKLSKKEVDWLVETWQPEPLASRMDKRSQDICDHVVTVESVHGNYLKLKGIQDVVLNLSTYDFIGSGQNPEIKTVSEAALHKYGCGSCGPRGFYGTIDVHLTLEAEIAKFMKVEEAIYYSDGASAVTSTIPAFSKKGDLIIMDEACNDAIRTGVDLSRSTVVQYRHNDMNHLREILESIASDDRKLKRDTSQQRRFIITEGIFQLTGTLCSLPEIVQLKNKYFYRVILDETLAIGTIGATGRGTTEYYNIPISNIEMVVFGLDTSLASVGGVCIGTHEIVDHQRLSGAGYCYSASVPPFLASAALCSLKRIENNGSDLITLLNQRATFATEFIKSINGLKLLTKSTNFNSPILQVYLDQKDSSSSLKWEDEELLLNEIVRSCHLNGVGITLTSLSTASLQQYSKVLNHPSIRICVSTTISMKELEAALTNFKRCFENVMQTHSVVKKFQ